MKDKLTITVEQELQPFSVPNYVLAYQPPRPRQEGVNFEGPKFALHELSDEVLGKLCDKFRDDVFRKVAAARAALEPK